MDAHKLFVMNRYLLGYDIVNDELYTTEKFSLINRITRESFKEISIIYVNNCLRTSKDKFLNLFCRFYFKIFVQKESLFEQYR